MSEGEVQVAVSDPTECECGAPLEAIRWPFGDGDSKPIVLCPVCDATFWWPTRVKGEAR